MDGTPAAASAGGVDHEAIWGPIGAVALLAARFLPLDRLPLTPCPLHALTGLPCLSCGGTRSFMAFARFDVPEAIAMNPLVAALAAITAVYVVHALGVWILGWRRWRPTLGSERSRRAVRVAAIAGLLLNWSYLIAVGR
ncbi:MAG: DUF2752 domain-containing protein [Acidobacteriota bacterium]|jgi:hypothetical protein